ncbi:MAG: HmuY family protein [Flavobacteriales bacterium]|nr:HmuY family protein [Flavobacteriales bacterium]
MLRYIQYFVLAAMVMLSACFSVEEAVEPYPRGASAELQIAVGEKYENQVYFDVEFNKVVRTNSKMLWDISFSCNGDSTIRLNSGRNMRAAITQKESMREVRDTAGLQFKWDWSNGKNDSTALSAYTFESRVCVIALGLDDENQSLGFVKVIFRIGNDTLFMSYAALGSDDIREAYIVKEPDYNSVHYSFLNHEALQAEPPKTDYDLLFTQYVHYFEEEDLAYLVMGTLLNPWSTLAYLSDEQDFALLDFSKVEEHKLSARADVIGYDWKFFSLGEGTYVVMDKQNYLLKDAEGFYYKLHFIGFYDNNGRKGFPVIAHEKI